MATCLVTGGAGFIGSHVAEALVRRGDRVRVLDNLDTGSLANLSDFADRVEMIEGDLTDLDTVRRATEGVEVVYHHGALASVSRSVEDPLVSHDVCLGGTLHVLVAARDNSVRRVVYAASSSMYGNAPDLPKRESHVPAPISPYGVAKLAGEYYCQTFRQVYGLETVCLRYFNVFGPRQDPESPYSAVIPLFISAAVQGDTITVHGDGEQTRDFTYVANVVQANLKAADAPLAPGRVYNVACGKRYSLNHLLEVIGKLLDVEVRTVYTDARPGDVKHSQADITLARMDLGYDPQIEFEEGLRLSIEYYKSLVGV